MVLGPGPFCTLPWHRHQLPRPGVAHATLPACATLPAHATLPRHPCHPDLPPICGVRAAGLPCLHGWREPQRRPRLPLEWCRV